MIQLHSHQTPHRTGTRPEIRGTQPHVGEGLEDEYSHFLVSLKGCTKQSKLWSHEQWKLLPQIVLTAVPRFFNHCTCTLYLKLPKNVLIVFSLTWLKTGSHVFIKGFIPQAFWERRLAPAKLQRLHRAGGLPDTPTLPGASQFGIWEIQSFVAWLPYLWF